MRVLPTLASALALSAVAQAQIGPGELVMNYPASGASFIEHYSTQGMVQGNISGGESSWISSAVLGDGRIVVHNNSTDVGIRILSPTGVLMSAFATPVAFYSGDIDLFADETIAICSRGEGLLLYALDGSHQGLISTPGMTGPQGCEIQADDTIWVADTGAGPFTGDGIIWHIDRQGNVIQSFPIDYDPSDVVQANDGTVWVSGWQGKLAHYTADGTLIHEFQATINHSLKTLWSLALSFDGTLWASGHYDTMVYGYDTNGNIVGSFDAPSAGNSTFMYSSPGISSDSAFCFGDGSGSVCPCGNEGTIEGGCLNSTGTGAVLSGSGLPSVSSDSIQFTTDNMIAGQAALLFVGTAQANAGNGQPFGDGLLCVGGGIQRIGVEIPDGAGSATWGPGIINGQGWAPGDTRYFQTWFRDTAGFPCGSGFNLSNGLEIVVTP